MEAFVLLRAAVLTLFSVLACTSYVEAGAGQGRALVGTRPLPKGACEWRQGSLINNISTGATQPFDRCRFVARDPAFLDILGAAPEIMELVKDDAHEGGVWFPDKNEFYYTSNRRDGANGDARSDIKKVSLATGVVTVLMSGVPSDQVPNGLALDNRGELLVCVQGFRARGGSIRRVNLRTLATAVVADNWFGAPFNSPNDVVAARDGSVWFTDPSYGSAQGFRVPPRVNNQLYRVDAAGVVDAVADGFTQPNGLAFSPDETRLYVTDTGFALGVGGQFDVTRPHSITVFDVGANGVLSNRRLFASVGVYDGIEPGLGIPDGIKVDTMGRVYVGTVDGVQVFGRSGMALGLIRQPGVANMGFAGRGLDTLYMLNDTSIAYVKLQVRAAGLKYASMF